jgi:hypothetical protein
LLYLRNATLVAQSFDQGNLSLRGDPFPVAEQVGQVFPSASKGLFTTAQGLSWRMLLPRLVAS